MNYKEEIEKMCYTVKIERSEVARNGHAFYRFGVTLDHADGTHQHMQRETSWYENDNQICWIAYERVRNTTEITSHLIQPQSTVAK